MQKKKIFVEIEIPPQARKRLIQKIEQWKNLPVKWMKEANLHVTLAFLGYVDESVLPEICQKVASAAMRHESFDLEFEKITLGPNPEDPQMFWLEGSVSNELKALSESIEKELGIFRTEHKSFRPHITLGRIRTLKWDALKNKPLVEEKAKLVFSVENVLVMESSQEKGVAGYNVLESCPLQ